MDGHSPVPLQKNIFFGGGAGGEEFQKEIRWSNQCSPSSKDQESSRLLLPLFLPLFLLLSLLSQYLSHILMPNMPAKERSDFTIKTKGELCMSFFNRIKVK